MKQQHSAGEKNGRSNAGALTGRNGLKGFSAVAQPVVQRVVNYPGNVLNANVNLAETVIRFTDYGTTHTLFNGTRLTGGNAATLLNGPTFQEAVTEEGVRLSVGADAVNSWACEVDLPTDPPWEMATTIERINMAVQGMRGHAPVYPKAVDKATAVRLTVKGAPDDGTFSQKVTTHELRHVTDNRDASETILEPWDARITNFRTGNRNVTGENAEAARTAFYNDIGSTPAAMGTGLYAELRNRGRAFHLEDTGKMPEVDSMLYNYSTKHFILKVRHTH